jgi:hypothetical protein
MVLNTITIITIIAYITLHAGYNQIDFQNFMRNKLYISGGGHCIVEEVLNIYATWCAIDEARNPIFVSITANDFIKLQNYRTTSFFSSGIIQNGYYILSKNKNYDYLFETYIESNNKAYNKSVVDSSVYLLKMMNRLSIDIFLPHFIQKYQYNIEENVERVYYDKFIKNLLSIKEDERIGNKLSKYHLPYMQDLVKNYMTSYTNITTDSNCIINTIREIYI